MAEEPDRQDARRWRSANELAKEYVGGHAFIEGVLKRLRSSLTADIAEQTDMAWEEAVSVVEYNLVKRLGPGNKPGPKALHATDDAVRLSGIKPREAKERRQQVIETLEEYRYRKHKDRADSPADDIKHR